MRYEDFNIRIMRKRDDGYDVAVDSPAGSANAHIVLPFDIKDAANQINQMGGSVRSGATREVEYEGVDTLSPSEFGSGLFKSLFAGNVGKMYNRSYAALNDPDVGLRIKLHLNLEDPDVSALAQVPWEFVYEKDTMEYLTLSRQTPIVRYIEVQRRPSAHALKGRLRILVVMSSPKGVHHLDLQKERRLIEDNWAGEADVEVDFLEHPTPEKLLDMLVQKQYHVLHYMGHGAHDKVTGAGALVLEDEHGDAVMLDAQTLGTWLRDAPTMRLAFLNACDTARTDEDEPFAGVANRLVMAGLPAVLAMQFPISDQAAIDFARAFYPRLVAGHPVDEATAQGRKAILAGNTGSMEWGTPVLYMRAPDGQLFDAATPVDHAQAAPPPAAPVGGPVTPPPPSPAKGGAGLKIGIGVGAAIALAALAFFVVPKLMDSGDGSFRWEHEKLAGTNEKLMLAVGEEETIKLRLVDSTSDGEKTRSSSREYGVKVRVEGNLSEPVQIEDRWDWKVTAGDEGTAALVAAITPDDRTVEPWDLTLPIEVRVSDRWTGKYNEAIGSLKNAEMSSDAVKKELTRLGHRKDNLSAEMREQLAVKTAAIEELLSLRQTAEAASDDPDLTLTEEIAAIEAWKNKFGEVRPDISVENAGALNERLTLLAGRTNVDEVILCKSFNACDTSIERVEMNSPLYVSVRPPTSDVNCQITGLQEKPCKISNSYKYLNKQGIYSVVITNEQGDLLASRDIEAF